MKASGASIGTKRSGDPAVPEPRPGEARREKRASGDHFPSERSISQSTDGESKDQIGERRLLASRADDIGDPTPIGEKVPLDQDRVSKLLADFPVACPSISTGERRKSSPRCALDDGTGRQIARNHRVVNAL